MRLFLLILFFSLSSNVFSADWPIQMHSIENFNKTSYNSLSTYFSNLKTNYAFIEKEKEIIFFTEINRSRSNQFKIIQKSFKSQNDIFYNDFFSFYLNNFLIETITIKRSGVNSFLKLKNFLNFSFLQSNYNYLSLKFSKFNININYLKTKENSKVTFKPYGDSPLEIQLIESYLETKQISQLYYQCDGCDGDKVTAVMNLDRDHYGEMSYYLSNNQTQVNPVSFYTQASGYLSGVRSVLDSMPNRFCSNLGFPLVE